MPKIKGWSRTQSKENSRKPYRWKHDKTKTLVFVMKEPPGYSIRYTPKGEILGSPKRLGTTSNLEQARDIAVRWMKKHPSGRTR